MARDNSNDDEQNVWRELAKGLHVQLRRIFLFVYQPDQTESLRNVKRFIHGRLPGQFAVMRCSPLAEEQD